MLLVVNSMSADLSVIPVDRPTDAVHVSLGTTPGTPVNVAARDSIALVALGDRNAIAVVELHTGTLLRTIELEPGSGAAGVTLISDSVAYVANPGLQTVTRLNIWSGDTASVKVGGSPENVALVRGRVFVLNGNVTEARELAPGPASPAWITVVDPITNARATGIDSIPLTGPGNARFADIGGDGLLYVVSPGRSGGSDDGRLSIVDPVARTEIASFAGFGRAPGPLASDGDERIFVSSRSEGLMVFDAPTRTVIRGAGNALSIPTNSTVAVDSRGRIYAIEAGACAPGQEGVVHVLETALVEIRTLPVGACPIAVTITKVP